MKRILQVFLFCLLAAPVFGAAKTQTRLLFSTETAKPGDTVWAGVELRMPAGWHSYWRNGGDSGLPTKVDWALPPGVTAGPLLWPVPRVERTPAGDTTLVTYVYDNTIVLLASLHIEGGTATGPLEIKAKVSWQECQEQCVQGHSEIQANLNVGATTVASPDASVFEQWQAKIPRLESNPKATARWAGPADTNDTRSLVIEWETPAPSADFYPYPGDGFEVSATSSVSNTVAGKIVIRKTVTKTADNWPTSLKGLLVAKTGEAIEVALPIPTAATAAGPEMAGSPSPNQGGNWALLPRMLLLAFLGGLILNVMPCVLPVISLKVLAFVNQSKESPARLRALGLVYGLGVLISFAVLAIFSIAVQRAGGVADWGAAFRNPQFRLIITVVITLVALNLFGVFEITLSGKAMGAADQLASKHGMVGAFFNGVLATVLATPCTAPFLGGALAFAFTQPPIINLSVFLSAGMGLALPFVAICLKPSLLKFLPRPGMWMERFKVGIGFAVLATAVWLFWLTATRIGKDGVLWLGLFLVVLSFAAWLWGQFMQRLGKRSGILIALAVLVFGYSYILEGKLHWRAYSTSAKQEIEWRPWSPEAVAKARSEGHPVLVDFTADSCLNCQVNKLTSIETPATRSKLKEINAVTFIADYTDENPVIARELAKFQRSGVPMVLVYPGKPNGDPIVLPTVLTPSIVSDALSKIVQ